MAANPKNLQQAAKDERARDAARAMQEYQAERRAVLARTERLRAQRLAIESGTVLKKTTKQAKENR